MEAVPSDDWMHAFLGTTERGLLEVRERFLAADGGALLHPETGRRWPTGRFECPSVVELQERVAGLPARERPLAAEPASDVAPRLTVADGVDIGRLQATLRTSDLAMVQVASNFNCLEVPSRRLLPDSGVLVEGYAVDATQGPAASFGVPAACLLRAHYVFREEDPAPSAWGQTAERQVELLRDAECHFGRCRNGKLSLDGGEQALPLALVGEAAARIRVGVHADCEVVFGRGASLASLELLREPRALVDQLLTASANWRDPGVRPPRQQLESLTRTALRAAYDGAYLAAILRGRRLLLLTLVGGGAFGNPEPLILEAIAAAHGRWAGHPASELREVRVCLFPEGAAARTQAALEELLGARVHEAAASGPRCCCQ